MVLIHLRRRSYASALVMLGTFLGPISQWMLFFLLARAGGSALAGEFAIIVAIAAPTFVLTNCGLRSGYITLKERYSYAAYFRIRVVSSLAGAVALVSIGLLIQLTVWFLLLIAFQKLFDALLDLEFAWLQRRRRNGAFGGIMTFNGVLTILLALSAVNFGLAAEFILGGSLVASAASFCVAFFVRKIAQADEKYVAPADAPYLYILRACWAITLGQLLAILIVNIPFWAVSIGGTAEDVGRFAAAAYMITVGSLMGSSLNSVVLGQYQHLIAGNEYRRVASKAVRGSFLMLGVGLVLAVAIGLFSNEFFGLIYGGEFQFTAFELMLIAAAAALNPGTHLMNAALVAANSYTRQMYVVLCALIAALLAASIGLAMGASGFMIGAVSALIGSFVKFVFSAYSLRPSKFVLRD